MRMTGEIRPIEGDGEPIWPVAEPGALPDESDIPGLVPHQVPEMAPMAVSMPIPAGDDAPGMPDAVTAALEDAPEPVVVDDQVAADVPFAGSSIATTEDELAAASEAAWNSPDQLAARVASIEGNAVSVLAYYELVNSHNALADRVAELEESLRKLWAMHQPEDKRPAGPAPVSLADAAKVREGV